MAQQKEWEEKYHYHEPHKVPSPMYKLSQTESQCLKCHQNVVYVPKADKLNKGRQLMHDYGCYGCHKIEGWEDLEKQTKSLQSQQVGPKNLLKTGFGHQSPSVNMQKCLLTLIKKITLKENF